MARELQLLRERLAFVEGQQAVPANVHRSGPAKKQAPNERGSGRVCRCRASANTPDREPR